MIRPTPIPAIAEIIILSVRDEIKIFIAIRAAPSNTTPRNVQSTTAQSGDAKNEIITA